MKKFENPEIEMIKFAVEDVITESSGNLDAGAGGLPVAP